MNSLLARLRDSPAIKNAPQYLQITQEEEEANPLPSLLLDSVFVDFFKSTCGKKKIGFIYEQKKKSLYSHIENVQKTLKKKPADFNRIERRKKNHFLFVYVLFL